MAKLPLSAFIICQNEEAYLENCLRSLALCSEIVIVDSGSTDGTPALVQRFIAEGWPIKFLEQKWLGYSAQKQFAFDQCSQPWRLNLDADERLDAELIGALPELLRDEQAAAWHVDLRPYLIGYGFAPVGVGEKTKLRLVRANRAKYDLSRAVHEGMVIDGPIHTARRGSILHYRPLPIDDILPKLNNYSTLKADKLAAANKGPRLFRLVFNPPMYFLRVYLRRGMIRCGMPGFIEAASAAIYSFLTEAKLYQRHALKRLPPSEKE
jgi:glycosyltransferase involved in cell wall biosynthesis